MKFYKLKKSGGSRLHSIHTYTNYCNSKKEKYDIVIPNTLLQHPSVNNTIVFKGKITNDSKNIVVKIQEAEQIFIIRELAIIKQLSNMKNNNFVKYICDFECNHNKRKYRKGTIDKICIPDKKDKKNNIKVHLILQEYINGGDMTNFIDKYLPKLDKKNQKKIITSLIKQGSYALAQASEKFNFTHNDIHYGNILISFGDLKKYSEKSKTYIINNKSFITKVYFDIEPVIVDYGRASIVNCDKGINDITNFIYELRNFSGFENEITSLTSFFARNFFKLNINQVLDRINKFKIE